MDFNDVFYIKFHKKTKQKSIDITRLLKTLGYKNLNQIKNKNLIDEFNLISAVLIPRNQGN